jgi:hypothetical protein
MEVLGLALDFPQDGVERVLECAVQTVTLRRPQLVQILVDALARVLQHVLAREDGPGDIV